MKRIFSKRYYQCVCITKCVCVCKSDSCVCSINVTEKVLSYLRYFSMNCTHTVERKNARRKKSHTLRVCKSFVCVCGERSSVTIYKLSI